MFFAGMSGRKLLDQLEHVIVPAADDVASAHLGEIRVRQTHGVGFVVDVREMNRAARFGAEADPPRFATVAVGANRCGVETLAFAARKLGSCGVCRFSWSLLHFLLC